MEKRGGSKLQVQGQGWRNVCAGNTFRPTTTYLSKRREPCTREGKSLRRTDLGKSLPFPRFKSLSFALYHFHLLDLAIWISFGPCSRGFSSTNARIMFSTPHFPGKDPHLCKRNIKVDSISAFDVLITRRPANGQCDEKGCQYIKRGGAMMGKTCKRKLTSCTRIHAHSINNTTYECT